MCLWILRQKSSFPVFYALPNIIYLKSLDINSYIMAGVSNYHLIVQVMKKRVINLCFAMQMFRAAARQTQHVASIGGSGVRHRSYYSRKNKKIIWQTQERTVPSNQPAAWSTGLVKHPAPLDCPVGNKDNYPKPMPDGGIQYFGFQYYPR